ncbi:MAG: hypothetical protein JW925_10500 [Syntrophaceae bacterium]|nr:hypothetical protein [Syntrophaceae bacterium]
MALVSLNLNPTEKQLREFCLAGLCMCLAIGLTLFFLNRIGVNGLLLAVGTGITLFVLSRISTALIKPIYLVLILVTFPIGWLISHFFMALFYFGIVSLIALIFKIIGRDPLTRKYDKNTQTYWISYTKKKSENDYFRQF